MDVQSIISGSLTDIAMALVSALIALAGYYLRKHFTAKQLVTAAGIAQDAVNFAVQAAKKHGITADLGKYNAALGKAKELAAKVGIKMTDSEWEGLIESEYKKAKDELAQLVGTATPYTQDEVTAMIQNEIQKFKAEVQKAAPSVPVDLITDTIKDQLGKMALTVNVAPVAATSQAEVIPASALRRYSRTINNQRCRTLCMTRPLLPDMVRGAFLLCRIKEILRNFYMN